MEGGEAVRDLVGEMAGLLPELEKTVGLKEVGARLKAGIETVEQASAWLSAKGGDPDSLAGAAAYLQLFGDVLGGAMLAKGALADPARAPLARIYSDHVLATAPGRIAAVTAGADDLTAATSLLG